MYSGVTNPSQTSADMLTGANQCGPATTYLFNEQGRCGYGPRLPLLVISPYARSNSVSNTLTDQSSILKFVEQNWSLGEIPGSAANIAGSIDGMFDFAHGAHSSPALSLSPKTGEPIVHAGKKPRDDDTSEPAWCRSPTPAASGRLTSTR